MLKDGKPYAQVEYGIEGFISTIQYFKEDGLLSANHLMDDRGLVSSVIYTKRVRRFTKTTLIPRDCGSLESTCKMGGVSKSILSLLFVSKKRLTEIWGELIAEF